VPKIQTIDADPPSNSSPAEKKEKRGFNMHEQLRIAMNESRTDELRIDGDRSASQEGPVTLETMGKNPLSRESRFRATADEERAGTPLAGRGKGADGEGQGERQAPAQFSLL